MQDCILELKWKKRTTVMRRNKYKTVLCIVRNKV